MQKQTTDRDQEAERRESSISIREMPAELVWKLAGAAALALVLGFLFLEVLYILIRPLGVLLAGVVVALTLAPIVDWLQRWMPRLAAVILIYFTVALLIVGAGALLLPPMVSQTTTFLEDLPDYVDDAETWFVARTGIEIEDNMDQVSGFAEPAADWLIGLPRLVITASFEILIGLFVSLYWLHCMPRLKAFVISLFPPHQQQNASDVLSRMGQRMGGYMRGVALTGLVVGTVVYIGMMILGLQYVLLLAVLSFFGEFFPNIGPVIAAIPAVALAAFDSIGLALIVIAFFVVIQQLESYILMPLIMRGQTAIPPLVTTFAVFAGFLVGGVLWAILAIPLSGACLYLTTDVVAPAIRRRTGATPVANSAE